MFPQFVPLFFLTDILVTTPNRLIYLLKQDPPGIDLTRYINNVFYVCFSLSWLYFVLNYNIILVLLPFWSCYLPAFSQCWCWEKVTIWSEIKLTDSDKQLVQSFPRNFHIFSAVVMEFLTFYLRFWHCQWNFISFGSME